MSIKKLNESIDNLLHEVEVSKVGIKPTFEEELRKSLKETLDYCIRNDRSLYGIADLFADRIESMVPDKRWWEVTDCDFYTEMFNTSDFNSVINCIIDELKPEYKQNVNESYNPEPDEVTDFKKAVNSADTIDDIQFLIYELSDGVAEEACQVAFDNAVNSDENDIDTVKDAVISAIDMYLEDNEFNESYQKDDTDSIKIDDSILKQSDKFKYQLLGRMMTDCSYFLGAGKGAEKFLWAGNVPEQIAYMKAIYNSFPDNKKPEWISLADIDEYEKKMLNLDESLDINDDNFADPLEAAQMSFESGHYAEENDFRTDEDYQKYVEYMDKGPEGFYEEFKDKLDFDPDFVAEYDIEEESLKEDTVKKSNGKWTNRGDDGTEHGKFRTKKQADAQRKAMFANGFKVENYQTKLKFEAIRPDSDLVKYQQWVDYDMKHDGKISNETKRLIRKAGLQVVKNGYGDYKVIHTVSDIRGILSQYPDMSIYTKDELGGDYKYHTLIKSREDALKYNYQPDFWGTADEYQKDNVKFVSELEPYIGKHVLAFDDNTVFILLGVLIDNQYNSLDHTKVLVEEVGNNKVNESIDTPKNKESVSKKLQEDDAKLPPFFVGDGETGSIYNSYDDAKRAYDYLKSRGVDAVMEPVEDISLHKVANPENKKSVSKNTLSEEYDEPELLGKGYAAPTSMDYVSNIKRLVKYKVTDFTDIQNLMQKTMESIDAFDDYWKVHKAAIMKNIKEAQDLIPTEYRI